MKAAQSAIDAGEFTWAAEILTNVTRVDHGDMEARKLKAEAYRRWAPVYDFTFGRLVEAGRRHTVEIMNRHKGTVLEVGVGTGLSLPRYGKHLRVTGIDISPDMLNKAKGRVARHNLENVEDPDDCRLGPVEPQQLAQGPAPEEDAEQREDVGDQQRERGQAGLGQTRE